MTTPSEPVDPDRFEALRTLNEYLRHQGEPTAETIGALADSAMSGVGGRDSVECLLFKDMSEPELRVLAQPVYSAENIRLVGGLIHECIDPLSEKGEIVWDPGRGRAMRRLLTAYVDRSQGPERTVHATDGQLLSAFTLLEVAAWAEHDLKAMEVYAAKVGELGRPSETFNSRATLALARRGAFPKLSVATQALPSDDVGV